MSPSVSLRTSDSDSTACARCLEIKSRSDLDRMLWCEGCCESARSRSSSQSRIIGFIVAVILSVWIYLYIQPSDLVIGGWIGTVLAAFYVSARVAREVLYAVKRINNRAMDQAVPPRQDSH